MFEKCNENEVAKMDEEVKPSGPIDGDSLVENDDFEAEGEAARGRDVKGLDEASLEVDAILLDIRLEILLDLGDVSEKVVCLDSEDVVEVFEEEGEISEEILEDVFDVGFDDDLEVDRDNNVDDILADEDLVVVFDEVLDVVFGTDTAIELLTSEDLLLVEIFDDVLDEGVDETFFVETEGLFEDILLMEAGTVLPSTHLHSLVKSWAEYFANGEVVLGLA